ncbi:ribosomal RNA processing protein 1 homolog B [Sander lucioperca]|uniref:Uncharacterized protein n=1 Tax=Sander lucioperca TaxID=283035 RepID=A0A8C9Z1A9_SANLU|nr:ribosomal RNA processing protein 1 homolog B [Sander lucioperca]
MASIQEPEVQFAQRLASNEKPIRTKAIKKLRKYINVRSHNPTGGFTGDELLKLWKGLFYCLWMQDKPLLQEELSNQISTLIHSFRDIDGQLLYLESFLQTFKREWTGIDRLRMDKFFQLVRFMFRQTFEMLKRKNWESCAVGRFLELLTAQLLQSSSGAPSGLQFHILDLYMTELAAVGSAELTADQNLIFIQPFCKTAAKTKDRSLFSAICNSIFSTIIDQAPFAIEDLMKEVKAEASDSDSGQASEEDDKEDQLKGKMSKPVAKKGTRQQINGNISNEEEGDDEDDDDELLHLEESDTEESCDEDVGPVLQFDYAGLADKLFELASRSSTPSQNRQRLYKIIRVLRDLNEGIFPQDEYPEEVSTDEDDEMFGSRKRMKRRGRRMEEEGEEDEGVPAAKKSKGKKKEASTLKQNEESVKDDKEPADLTANNETKKRRRKRKKKKKAGQGGSAGGEENAERSEQAQAPIKETDGGAECSQTEDLEKEAQAKQSSISSVEVTEAATPDGQRETLLVSEVKKQPTVTVTEETSQPAPCTTDDKDQSEQFSKNKKKRETPELEPVAAEEQQTAVPTEPETSSNADATVSGKKRKKMGLKAKSQTDEIVAKSQLNAEAEIAPVSSEQSAEKNAPDIDATTPAKKKKKNLKAEKNLAEVEVEARANGVSTEVDLPSTRCEDPEEGDQGTGLEKPSNSAATCNKKSKKKNLGADVAPQVEAEAQFDVEGKHTDAEIASVPLKKKTKKKGKQVDASLEAFPAADESTVTPLKKKRKKNPKESETSAAAVDAEKLPCEVSMTTPAKKKKKKMMMAAAQVDEKDHGQSPAVGSVDAELPSDEMVPPSGKAGKKKRKIPVVFEYEADELEAAAQEATAIKGLAEEETVAKKLKAGGDVGEPATPLRAKKSQKKPKTTSASDFVTFQSNATVPTPLFCKTKGSPSPPLSSKKKSQTPKSESKKVTFGLKNNKTAEFRKTDRSLLLSPDGSSRVPFDPKQKPKFGVLKSPPTPLSARKTPKANRKTSSNTPKSTPKGRPTAADFF